jgi:hypothetical protein
MCRIYAGIIIITAASTITTTTTITRMFALQKEVIRKWCTGGTLYE